MSTYTYRSPLTMEENNTRIIDWCAAKEITDPVKEYVFFYHDLQAKHPGVPESVWHYFDYDKFLLDLWRLNKIRILYVDEEGVVPLEDSGDVYPAWKGMETEWFSNHPFKHMYYIVHTTNES